MENNRYSTLSEATSKLSERGYTISFSLLPNGIEDKAAHEVYDPAIFDVDEYHRFEGDTNPGDMAIIFAITTKDGKMGTLIDAYGTYEDPLESAMLHKLNLSEK